MFKRLLLSKSESSTSPHGKEDQHDREGTAHKPANSDRGFVSFGFIIHQLLVSTRLRALGHAEDVY